MCYSPTYIKNPNWHHSERMSFMKDCVSQYIPVPCGHCGECVAIRSANYVQRAQLEAQFGYCYFCTLTYNNESLPVHECSDGVRIRYADIRDVQNMLKRLRASNVIGRPLRYLGVTELGKKRGRPHVHILFFVKKEENDHVFTPWNIEKDLFSAVMFEWRRNYGSSRNPEYRPLCTYVRRFVFGKLNTTYDLHYVVPSAINGNTEDVTFYITKYLFKDSDAKDRLKLGLKSNLDADEFYEVWSKVRPRSFCSLNFGFGYYGNINPRQTSSVYRKRLLSALPSADLVRSSIARSRVSDTKPRFYDLETGKALPLSRYWYKFGDIYTMDDALDFYYKNPDGRLDNVSMDDRDMTSRLIAEQKYIKNLSKIENESDNFDLIYAES